MRRLLPLSLLLVALTTAPAYAEPGITVTYDGDFLRVALDGSYGGAYYQIWRSAGLAGPYDPLQSQYTLCTGDCFLNDQQAVPGRTYFYRFDLQPTSGGTVSYGPYAVTVPDTPLAARAVPNPSAGAARIELSLPGSRRWDAPVPAEARLLDLQGRTVRVLYSGTLARGVTTVSWDGTAATGGRLGAGMYFVRLSTPLGISTSRIVRIR
jgi:hypothetical protein